jgi:hypothetical protein
VTDYFSSPEDPSYVLLGLDVRAYEYSVPGRPEVIRVAKR